MRRTMIIGALLAGGLALAGCAPSTEAPSSNPPAPGTPPPPSEIAPAGPENSQGSGDEQGQGQGPGQGEGAGEGPSSTDQQFAQMMVPHHEQALELSELATSTSQNPQVRDLASRIAQAQGPEIGQMRAWLGEQQGQGGETPQQGGMSGMVSPEAMDALRQASGEEFDRLWIEAMIQHHEGAVEMAQTQLEEGSDPRMRGLAEQIVGAQEAELQELRSLQG
ncbi:DUF305 domain-containing protein [Allosaccharopolyspora coralli]|uniref:DUF305 domain-containing protein n=1 Tax=Allosaccharopolyspora coralli TaxID=2665642 RepID=A0A5Q3Q355_9PSEU|nr:DUF305 domain-containing protein [Allosaccharopolyspora coralli]QGK69021.1 DUF305 domain-containing protein [Allosaccharopolyspora coralli]